MTVSLRRQLGMLLWVLLAFFAESALPSRIASGQFNNALFAQRGADEEQGNEIFVPAPLELKRHLTVAKRALDEQRFSEAVIQLGELLAGGQHEDGQLAQDYFIGRAGQTGAQLSLKEEALRLIGSMPAKGRELYELQFGAEARALLDEGVKEGSFEKLTQVARRYFHTKAGYDATYLMGRYELDLDQPLAAALCFQRLVEYSPDAKRFEPELSVLLATCWARAGMPEKARETLENLQRARPGSALVVAGEKRPLPSGGDANLAWLDTINGVRTEIRSSSAVQWVMHRGDASRTARSQGGTPLLNSRWRVPTANDPADERLIQKISRDYQDRNVAALPALQPLVVDDFVLMRTPRRLIGVDFRSGKRVWEWPHSSDLAQQPPDGRAISGRNNVTRSNEVNQRIWEDAPYGQISSDGRSVFFLDDLGTASVDQQSARMMPFGNVRPGGSPNSSNTLVGLDLGRQGYLKWRIGGETGLDEPQLAGAFFLGSPLPLMDRLYVLAEVNSEIRLIVVDAETGRLQWSQQLAYLDTRPIQMDPLRRLGGASPSFADGVLICPTSAGAAVAIDVTTRALRWGYTYKTNQPVFNQFGFQPQRVNTSSELGDRWADSSATIAGGRVILTPVEADELYCLDLLTGEPAWEPKKRGDLLYVACIHEGMIVLVGKHQVAAVRLSDGSDAWKQVVRLPEDDLPSGRGFYADQHYYLPTTGSRLLKIDLSTGQIAETISTDSVLGNLVCYGDEVISQSSQYLKTFYQAEGLRDQVAQRLKANPKDVWALTRQGELLMQAGEQTDALAALHRAHAADTAELGLHKDEIDALLIRTMLAALKQDFVGNQAVAAELSSLITQPEHHAEYLRLSAEGYQETGQLEKSFAAFLKLVELDKAELSLDASEENFERSQRGVIARRDRWVQSHLMDLFTSADDDSRAAMLTQLTASLDSAMGEEGAAGLRRFVKYFGALPMASQARLALAERLTKAGGYLEAELLWAHVAASHDPALAAQATERIAALLVTAGRPRDAALYYEQLASRWPDQKLQSSQSAADAAAEALAQPALEAGVSRLAAWPMGKVNVDEASNTNPRFSGARMHGVRLEQVDGFGLENIEMSVDHQRNLVLRTGDGDQVSQIPLSTNQRYFQSNVAQGRANGHLLVVSTGHDLAAIDLLRAVSEPNYALLWRKDLMESLVSDNRAIQAIQSEIKYTPWGTSRTIAVDAQKNVLGSIGPVTSQGVYYQRFREIICVDPLSGEKIWSRNQIEPGSFLFGNEQQLFVVPPKGKTGLVLSAIDGRTIKEIPFSGDDELWATSGSRFLSYRQVGNELHLRLFDMAAERDVWTFTFPMGSKGDLIGSDAVAVVEPTGRIRVLSLTDDTVLVDHKIDAESSLESVVVKRFSDQYIVALKRAIQYDARVSVSAIGNQFDSPTVNGPVFAFDRATGQPQWQTPAMVSQFPMPLDQPSDSPILLFARSLRTTPPGGNRGNFVSVLALDRRDGRVLLSQDEIPGATPNVDLRVQRRQNKVTINLQVRTFTLTFTEEPTPPSPPATAGDLSHLLVESPVQQLRQQAEAAVNNIRDLRRRALVPIGK